MNSSTAIAAENGGAGVGLTFNVPHVYALSYETLNRSKFTYAISAGYVPPITIKTASVSAFSADVRARWHPFSGSFFLGAAGGYQSYSGSGNGNITVAAQAVPINVKDTLSSAYLTPHLGWLWFFGKLIVGLEVGSQIGIGTSNKIDLTISDPDLQSLLSQVQTDTEYTDLENSIEDSLKGLTSLPYIGFKLGWKF